MIKVVKEVKNSAGKLVDGIEYLVDEYNIAAIVPIKGSGSFRIFFKHPFNGENYIDVLSNDFINKAIQDSVRLVRAL